MISGFRVARGGAQELLGVEADLTVMGKVLGGGLPAAAYGGPRELMERIAPAGDVYQAGTLSGNPARRCRRPRDPAQARRGRLPPSRCGHREARRRPPGGGGRPSGAGRERPGTGHRLLHARTRCGISPARAPATRTRTAASAAPCSTAVSIRPPRSSRPGSRLSPTTTRRSVVTIEAAAEAFGEAI